jgi:catechol 2,3-dioxygenase-like lactoylglutathione lyase family enzyme
MKLDMILLSVNEPARSVAFYSDLLGREPIDNSPMFKLNDATKLGLWIESGIEPKVTTKAGASELGIHMTDRAAVDATHDLWKSKAVKIAQAPTKMDFGYTFVGLDPDGHRLRVFCPE